MGIKSKVKDAVSKLSSSIYNSDKEAHKEAKLDWGKYFNDGLDESLRKNYEEPDDKTTVKDTQSVTRSVFKKEDLSEMKENEDLITDAMEIDVNKLEKQNLKEWGFDGDFNTETLRNGEFNSEDYLKKQGVNTENLGNIKRFIPKDFSPTDMAKKAILPSSSEEPSVKLPNIKDLLSGKVSKIKTPGFKDEKGHDFSFNAKPYSDKVKEYTKYFDMEKILEYSGIDINKLKKDAGEFTDSIKNMKSIKGPNNDPLANLSNIEGFDANSMDIPSLESFNLSDEMREIPKQENTTIKDIFDSGLDVNTELDQNENFSSVLNSGFTFNSNGALDSLGNGLKTPELSIDTPSPMKANIGSLGSTFSSELLNEIQNIKKPKLKGGSKWL